MTVGKLKEYLNDIDDNVEIKGLLLRCENGYAIQSKMRWIDNEEIIEELENLKRKMEDILAMQDGEGDFYNGLQVGVNNDLLIINNRISELKDENNGDNP